MICCLPVRVWLSFLLLGSLGFLHGSLAFPGADLVEPVDAPVRFVSSVTIKSISP